MKLIKKLALAVAGATLVLINSVGLADAYTINNQFKFNNNMGSQQYTANNYVILHEVGTESSAWANAHYMYNSWATNQAYTHYVVGNGGVAYAVGQEGKVAWGAGSYANANAPVQIELERTSNKATFNKDYKAYIDLARDSAKKYNIPLVLDGSGRGVKTHNWISQNLWGDHIDPISYLKRWGITQSKLAHDIKYGLGGNTSNVQKPSAPNKPSVSYPTSWTFTANTNIRTGAGTGYRTVGLYLKGQRVNAIKGVSYANGYYWAKYLSYSGSYHYVALIGYKGTTSTPNKPQATSGYYRVKYNTNIRSGAGTGYAKVGLYLTGQGFYYDSKVVANGHTWLSYVSYSGQRRYVAIN